MYARNDVINFHLVYFFAVFIFAEAGLSMHENRQKFTPSENVLPYGRFFFTSNPCGLAFRPKESQTYCAAFFNFIIYYFEQICYIRSSEVEIN